MLLNNINTKLEKCHEIRPNPSRNMLCVCVCFIYIYIYIYIYKINFNDKYIFFLVQKDMAISLKVHYKIKSLTV